jgi:aspartyl-tRNA(Asn)/glutamyl-tRNA(Gln) amidotransferase subunit C
MEITMDLISYLEKLGRIRLTDEEKEKAIIDLSSILGYIDKLNELDTDSVEPLSHAFPITNVFREDVVTNSDRRDAILSNAPAQKDGSFKVPKTVE